MSPVLYAFLMSRLRQPSSYAGLVAFIAWITHSTVPEEIAIWIEGVCAFVFTGLMIYINERRGPNPQNAPLPPQGTVPVVTAGEPSTAAVLVQPASDQAIAISKSAVSTDTAASVRSATASDPERTGSSSPRP
jgi:hypothetical protein